MWVSVTVNWIEALASAMDHAGDVLTVNWTEELARAMAMLAMCSP